MAYTYGQYVEYRSRFATGPDHTEAVMIEEVLDHDHYAVRFVNSESIVTVPGRMLSDGSQTAV